MKSRLFFLALFLGLSLSLSAQSHISFSYDNNGNRTSRTLKITALKSGQLTFPVDPDKLEEQQEVKKGIAIYPNPATTNMIISIDGYSDVSPKSITIYSIKGVIMHRLDNLEAENEIDLSAFEDGVYVMRILIGSESYSYKIIKSK